MSLFVIYVTVIVFSSLMYFAERGEWSEEAGTFVTADGEPSSFSSIFAASWFVIITLTQVGLGVRALLCGRAHCTAALTLRSAGRDSDDGRGSRGGRARCNHRRPHHGHPHRHREHQLPERVRGRRAATGGDRAAADEAGGDAPGQASGPPQRVGACASGSEGSGGVWR